MSKTEIPSIRFRGFDDAWEQRKLGDVVKEITRNDPESEAPIMMITANNGFIEQSERYAFNNAGESLKKYILLKKGELAYNHGASKLRPYGSCFALTTAENARIPFVYHCFSAENQNAEFMSIELNGAEIENQLRKIVSSGARMDGLLNISFDEYTSVSVILPGTEEQDRIADFSRHLDNLITLHQRKLEKLVNVKKSMFEKMFPKDGADVPEVRFKGFTDAWEQRKLNEVVNVYDGVHQTPDYKDSGVMFLSVENISTLKSEKYISEEAFQRDYKVYPQKGDILMTRIGDVGTPNVVETTEKVAFYVSLALLKPTKINSYFLCNSIQSPLFQKGLKDRTLVTAIPQKINKDEIGKVNIILPTSSQEQQLIGEYFRNLDNLITLYQCELEKFQNLKKALLEKMFV